MAKIVAICLLVIFSCVKIITGAKILAIMAIASPSHHVWNSVLINELAKKGHDVTYFSPDDKNLHPNVRAILAEDVYSKLHAEINIEDMVKSTSVLQIVEDMNGFTYGNCKHVIESKGFEKLLQIVKKETFDVILIDFALNECLLPIADEMKNTPIVGVTAFGGTPLSHALAGNPEMLAIKPSVFLQASENMTLLQRIQNVVLYFYYYEYNYKYNVLPQQVELARTRFPNVERKDIDGVIDRFSLVLVNNHFSYDPVVPTVPGLVHVGGLQVKPPKALPQDLQKFLDESTHGAILLSLGSNVKSSKLSEEKKKIILESLKELAPIRVLWKFEVELPGKPDNVMISKWLPQNDVLAHPNLKLFFTHSGLLSTLETIYHGKPIVGMPFLVDQHINVDKCVREGFGEKMDFLTMDKKTLVGTIKKVWNDPKYTNRAQQLSKIFKDRPQTPLETAVFWIEYVVRHKGAAHLRSPTLNLTWYQNNLLDVFSILAVALVTVLLIICKVLTFVFGFIFKSNVKDKKLKRQ